MAKPARHSAQAIRRRPPSQESTYKRPSVPLCCKQYRSPTSSLGTNPRACPLGNQSSQGRAAGSGDSFTPALFRSTRRSSGSRGFLGGTTGCQNAIAGGGRVEWVAAEGIVWWVRGGVLRRARRCMAVFGYLGIAESRSSGLVGQRRRCGCDLDCRDALNGCSGLREFGCRRMMWDVVFGWIGGRGFGCT